MDHLHGYVGFEEGGQLTEKIRNKPYSVILLDEIEKAHADVTNILLQILDDGRLTDSNGREVDFKNTIIIMTSNIGARKITERKNLGFIDNTENDEQKEYENTKKEVMAELKKELSPEFLNRIDEIIVFHKLSDKDIDKIIDIMLKKVKDRMKNQGYKVKFDNSIKKQVAKRGTNKKLGARPLKRTIQTLVENNLAEAILEGDLPKGKTINIGITENNKLIYKI